MAFNPAGLGECDRLKEMMAASEEELLAQRVCVLKPHLVFCTVATQLAGARVKVKCRGGTATLMKSEACDVPEGGGQIDLIEPIGDLVYEGDGELHFKLCRVQWWRSSSVVASGSLSMATVLGTVGLGGDTAFWTVPLMSKDGRKHLASLEVSIRCRKGSLRKFGGGGALKKLSLPERPNVPPGAAGSATVGYVVMQDVGRYCAGCRRSQAILKQATALAVGLAEARGVEAERPPSRGDTKGKVSL